FLLRLLVCVKTFLHAYIAHRSVFPNVTIEQTLVTNATVAVAVARLLIKNAFYFRCDRVCILHDWIPECSGIHRLWQCSSRYRRVISRSWLWRPGVLSSARYRLVDCHRQHRPGPKNHSACCDPPTEEIHRSPRKSSTSTAILLAGRSAKRIFTHSPAPPHINPQPLDLLVQRRKRDHESLRGLGLVPVRALQHVHNNSALDLVHD